jgi:hypothetical protein
VKEAEAAEGEERQVHLLRVVRIGEELSHGIDERWEGIPGLLGELVDGIRGHPAPLPRARGV